MKEPIRTQSFTISGPEQDERGVPTVYERYTIVSTKLADGAFEALTLFDGEVKKAPHRGASEEIAFGKARAYLEESAKSRGLAFEEGLLQRGAGR